MNACTILKFFVFSLKFLVYFVSCIFHCISFCLVATLIYCSVYLAIIQLPGYKYVIIKLS